jgi:hypothetical protein
MLTAMLDVLLTLWIQPTRRVNTQQNPWLVLAQPCDLPRRTDATAVSVNPEADQELRVGVASSGVPVYGIDAGVVKAQLQLADQAGWSSSISRSTHTDRNTICRRSIAASRGRTDSCSVGMLLV